MIETGLKRAAVIEDLSGYGRCALTIALPVLAACGVESVPIPTAVLSSHMGLPGAVITDLTDTMLPAAQQYHALNVPFDALYVGFLNSETQLTIVEEMCALLKKENTLLLLDPVMGDNGRLYRSVTTHMAEKMRLLCKKADFLTPNLTEAAALLGLPLNALQTKEDAAQAAKQLCVLGAKNVILTGVPNGERISMFLAQHESGAVQEVTATRIDGAFHGTGDLFDSVLLGKLLRNVPPAEAVHQAAAFVSICVERTSRASSTSIGGLHFEAELHRLWKTE